MNMAQSNAFWRGLAYMLAVLTCCSCLAPPVAAQADMLSLAEGFLVGGSPSHTLKSAAPRGKGRSLSKPPDCTLGPLDDAGLYLEAEVLPFERIQDLMGPAPEVSAVDADVEGFPGRCYVSGRADDHTAVLFLWGTNGMAQGMAVFADRRMLEPQVACAPSPRVNARLGTRKGLRLGMTRKEVAALLGTPQGQDATRFGYAHVSRLPAARGLLRRIGRHYEQGETAVVRVREVMIWFRGEHVVGFSVEQHSHYN